MAECVQISTTFPDQKTAQSIATRLVEERLAACAQVVGPGSSTYWWEGKVEQATEWYCHLKTTTARQLELQRRIRELHPYEVPEIIGVEIKEGAASYLEWIEETVRPTRGVPAP